MTNSSSARSARRRARSRSTSCTTSFAISGSYRSEISSPARTPESTRTPIPPGSRYAVDATRRRQEAARDVLGVDTALDRVAAESDVLLREGERLAGCDEDLLPDEIDPRHGLGDGVLDLDPRVHLQEVVRPVGGQQPFDRPGRPVARPRERPRPRSTRFAPGAPRRPPETASPRRASDGAAESCSRARRDG